MEQSLELIGVNGELFQEAIDAGNFDEDVFQGDSRENLAEYAGRQCYSSGYVSGKNRNSYDYHKYIKSVKHFSIYEHANVTIEVSQDAIRDWCFDFMNELGWYSSKTNTRENYLLTVNYRFLERVFREIELITPSSYSFAILYMLRQKVEGTCVFNTSIPVLDDYAHQVVDILQSFSNTTSNEARLDCSVQNQYWFHFLIRTNRHIAQEWLRHRSESGVSMPSMRYVDPSKQPFIYSSYVYDAGVMAVINFDYYETLVRKAYIDVEKQVSHYLSLEGNKNKKYIRKQSRGSSIAFLPLGLETQIVYSCSLRQAKEIVSQCDNTEADSMIQELAAMLKEHVDALGNIR